MGAAGGAGAGEIMQGAGQLIGAVGGVVAAHKSAQQSVKAFREARMAANRLYAVGNQAAGTATAYNKMAQQTLAQAEQARTGLISQLGAPGTYEQSYEDFVRLGGTAQAAPAPPTVSGPADYGSLKSYISQYIPGIGTPGAPGVNTAAMGTIPGGTQMPAGLSSTQFQVLNSLVNLMNQAQLTKSGKAQGKLQDQINTLIKSSDVQGALATLQGSTASPYGSLSQQIASAKKKYSLPSGLSTATGMTIDPEKYVSQIMSSREGRMVSYMTAQADQLVRGEGPLYNSLINNIQSSLFDSAAALSRQNAEQLRMMAAQGGEARNRAVATALQQQNLQNIQMNLAGQVAQSRMNLQLFAMDNARRTAAFNEAWSNGLPGISQSFLDAWTQIAQFYGNSILPQVIASAGGAAAASQNAAAFQAAAQNNGQLWGAALSTLGGAVSGMAGLFQNRQQPISTGYTGQLSAADTLSLFGAGGATSLPAGASDLTSFAGTA